MVTLILAVRLAAIVPAGFHVTMADGMLRYSAEPGRFPGQAGDYRVGTSGSYVTENAAGYDRAEDFLVDVAARALDGLQDFVSEATHEPWPGDRAQPVPRAQICGTALHLWYGGDGDDMVLACEPIPLADLGPRDLPLRQAGRVIVLDPDGRVLLFRYDGPPPNGRRWTTPGGGLDDGEDFAAGARRQLAEETGWTDVALGPQVHEQTITMGYEGQIVRQHERYFLGRVPEPRQRPRDVAALHASDGIRAWRWWTADELDRTGEVIWPGRLASLIRTRRG